MLVKRLGGLGLPHRSVVHGSRVALTAGPELPSCSSCCRIHSVKKHHHQALLLAHISPFLATLLLSTLRTAFRMNVILAAVLDPGIDSITGISSTACFDRGLGDVEEKLSGTRLAITGVDIPALIVHPNVEVHENLAVQ